MVITYLVLHIWCVVVLCTVQGVQGDETRASPNSIPSTQKNIRPFIHFERIRARRLISANNDEIEPVKGSHVYIDLAWLIEKNKMVEAQARKRESSNLQMLKKLWLRAEMDELKKKHMKKEVHSLQSVDERRHGDISSRHDDVILDDSGLKELWESSSHSQISGKRDHVDDGSDKVRFIIRALNKLDAYNTANTKSYQHLHHQLKENRNDKMKDDDKATTRKKEVLNQLSHREWIKEMKRKVEHFVDNVLYENEKLPRSTYHDNGQKKEFGKAQELNVKKSTQRKGVKRVENGGYINENSAGEIVNNSIGKPSKEHVTQPISDDFIEKIIDLLLKAAE